MKKIDFDKGDGLVPVVIQDEQTMKVLMLGYMNEEAWKAVATAIQNQIAVMKAASAKELEQPTPESAKIARYNSQAHFRFASERANAEVDDLLDSLVNCKLRSRPMNYSKKDPVREQMPFEYRTYHNEGFDIDGNLIAMCGDKYHDNIRESKNFVGCQRVPCPVNLESSNTLCELRDSQDSNEPWDTNTVTRLHKDKCGAGEWYNNCIADEENSCVWASTSSGTVHAYPTKSPGSEPLATLGFLCSIL